MALLNIRQSQTSDVNALLRLIRSLAEYEKAPDEVTNTAEQLLKDGFEENLFHAFVAELDNKIIGMALCYYRYSTWKGKCLYQRSHSWP